MKKSRKVSAVMLSALLFTAAMAQTVFAVTGTIHYQENVPAGDVVIEAESATGDGILAVDPSENITLNGDIIITVTSEGDLVPVIGVSNIDSAGYTVRTQDITVDAPGYAAFGVEEVEGTTYVDGDITASTYGIAYHGGTVICTGTVGGGLAAINIGTGVEEQPVPVTADSIIVYKLSEETGEALLTIGGENDTDEDDTLLKKISYIIKREGAADKITLGAGEVTQVAGFDTAHAGDVLHVKLASGYTFGSTVEAKRQADGSWLVTVPRNGGVTLTAILKAITGSSSSAVAGAAQGKQYTEKQYQAALNVFGGAECKTFADIQGALAAGKSIFVTDQLMNDPQAVALLFSALQAGTAKVFHVLDSGELVQTTIEGSQLKYSTGVLINLELPNSQFAIPTLGKNSNEYATLPKEAQDGNLIATSNITTGALFSNEFTVNSARAAGISSIEFTNSAMNLNVPVDSLTRGGRASIKIIQESPSENKLVMNNIHAEELIGESGEVLAGRDKIKTSFENTKDGYLQEYVTVPAPTAGKNESFTAKLKAGGKNQYVEITVTEV